MICHLVGNSMEGKIPPNGCVLWRISPLFWLVLSQLESILWYTFVRCFFLPETNIHSPENPGQEREIAFCKHGFSGLSSGLLLTFIQWLPKIQCRSMRNLWKFSGGGRRIFLLFSRAHVQSRSWFQIFGILLPLCPWGYDPIGLAVKKSTIYSHSVSALHLQAAKYELFVSLDSFKVIVYFVPL